jgi:site-specific recombinase XerD
VSPALSGEEVRELLAGIDTRTIAGLRDRALIGVMLYSFARSSRVPRFADPKFRMSVQKVLDFSR